MYNIEGEPIGLFDLPSFPSIVHDDHVRIRMKIIWITLICNVEGRKSLAAAVFGYYVLHTLVVKVSKNFCLCVNYGLCSMIGQYKKLSQF